MKFVIVLCEGPHDVAFLYRVLKAGHFEICSGEIEKLPEILKNNLRQRFKKININNLELCDIRPGIPSMIMNKVSEQLYVVMHALGGKDKIKEAQNIIDGYHLLLPESEIKDNVKLVDYLAFVCFLDANSKGIEKNTEHIKKIFSGICEDIEEKGITHGKIVRYCPGGYLGGFIVSGPDQKGSLEDIIMPLMGKNHEETFSGARHFLTTYCEDKYKKSDESKALIGLTGQLFKAGRGYSNFVIIRDSIYLTDEKIREDTKCGEIIDFFSRLRPPGE